MKRWPAFACNLSFLLSAVPFLILSSSSLRAADNWPKPITPSKSDTPAKITTPSTGTLPNAINTPPAAILTSTISDTRPLLLPALLDKMKSGDLAPQQAWDDKLIDVDDLLWIFTNKIDAWGGFYWEKNLSLRQDLEKVLAQNGGEKLQPIEKLPPTVRLWLADYYESIGDEKCLALCESIVKEIKLPVQSDNPLLFQTLERKAWYYEHKGQHETAAKTWESIMPAFAARGWWDGDVALLAARQWEAAGDAEKAKAWRARLPELGNGYATAIAAWEVAGQSVKSGKTAEAKQLLLQTAQSTKEPDGSAAAYAFLAMLENSMGEREAAFKHSELALSDFKKVSPNGPWHAVLGAAQDIYTQNGGWKTQPVRVEATSLNITFQSPEKPAIGRLRLASYGDTQIQVTCDNPLFKVRLAFLNGWDDTPVGIAGWNREVVIEVLPDALAQAAQQPLEATLTLSSAGRAAAARKVMVSVKKMPQKS